MVITRVEKKNSVSKVPMVREFSDVFSDDLPGAPPKRPVEFRIDLKPDANLVSKAPYRLVSVEKCSFFQVERWFALDIH